MLGIRTFPTQRISLRLQTVIILSLVPCTLPFFSHPLFRQYLLLLPLFPSVNSDCRIPSNEMIAPLLMIAQTGMSELPSQNPVITSLDLGSLSRVSTHPVMNLSSTSFSHHLSSSWRRFIMNQYDESNEDAIVDMVSHSNLLVY